LKSFDELRPAIGIDALVDCVHAEPDFVRAARLADAVRDADGLHDANAILTRMGVATELDYEVRMAQ